MTSIAELKARVARVQSRIAGSQTTPAGKVLLDARRVVASQVADIAGTPAEHVAEAHSLSDRWGFDTLDRLNLALSIEEAMQIDPLKDWEGWQTVGDVVRDVLRAAAG